MSSVSRQASCAVSHDPEAEIEEEEEITPIVETPKTPISTRICATVTSKASPSTPFLNPFEPPSSLQLFTQQTNHFAQVPQLNPKGKNITIFKQQWHITIAAAGIAHLFNKKFKPPTQTINLSDPITRRKAKLTCTTPK
jgi:hypothetical protein